MSYWLMKSEPDVFSIDDLAARPHQIEPWNGVRNYQVRNMFRDQMKQGDLALFYHSSCAEPGLYGLMKIITDAYPDPTQFDPDSEYYDAASRPEEPRWLLVEVQFVQKFAQPVLLSTLREHADELAGLRVLEKGTRLSVTPVTPAHWKTIGRLAGVAL